MPLATAKWPINRRINGAGILAMEDRREAVVISQIGWRILPLLFAGYFTAYIDRVNVGFAALTMNQALGLSAAQYGLGGGLFFAGYVAFGVPSNLVLARLGARVWLPIIMVAWALASLLNAWASGAASFYAIRLILGVAEAGLYPGLLFVLTEWLPGRYRVRMITLLVLSTPVSIMLGSLISQPILRMDGYGGLAGWQWLFVLQALPTIALALIFYLGMPDSPATARWLTAENRQWLVDQLAREREKREQVGRFSVKGALTNPTVWLIAIAGIGINFAAYGLILFMPQMIHALGVSTALTPLVNAIPFAVCAVVMVLWSNHSDKSMERNWHAAIPAALAGLALIACAFLQNPILTTVALTLGITGIFCYVSIFWAVPSAMLTGAAAAAGLALINAVANLGSFAGPYALGWVKDVTGSFSLGIVALGLGPLAAAVIAASLRAATRFEKGGTS
jgi:MFS transporter, ACS family, tartrate transporter